MHFARKVQEQGACEILINSTDKGGAMRRYDMALVDLICRAVNIPLTVITGAGVYADLAELIKRHGIIGAASVILFAVLG